MNSTILSTLAACPQCDLLVNRTEAPANHTSSCPRCGCVLSRNHSGSLEKSFALTITGLLLYFPAILMPLLTLEKLGMSESANVLDTILRFFQEGYYFVSTMTLVSAVIMPFVLLSITFTICWKLLRKRPTPKTAQLFRRYIHLEEWAMLEVYLIGVLVTIFKITDMADVVYGIGFFSFITLVFISQGINVVMDKNLFWDMLDLYNNPSHDRAKNSVDLKKSLTETTALQAGLASCHTCGKLDSLRKHNNDLSTFCNRCGDKLHLRKPQSLSKTLALVITAAILMIPANVLPIMRVEFLGVSDSSTILDGIILFFEEGSYGIGLIIFVASVLVPLFKIAGLTILLFSSRFRLPHFLRQKTQMFRAIAFIGRWSMLDVFVIALLISLVDFGFFTSIHAAPGATFFCLVVAVTMIAATTFDPRIMWDNCRPCNISSSTNH